MVNRLKRLARAILTIHLHSRERAAEAAEVASAIETCEQLLAGRVLHEVEDAGTPYPQWVWMNALAHGSQGDLEELTKQKGFAGDDPEVRKRRAMVRLLARELLDCARTPGVTVADLQRTVVIPIELHALSEHECPATLVRLVRCGLKEATQELRAKGGSTG
jgi:hypothetical protein